MVGIMKRFLIFLLVVAFATVCQAANDLDSNPNRIDTFGADAVIHASSIQIKNITITAYTSAKNIVFIDADGDICLVLVCPAGESVSWPPAGSGPVTFANGITFDDSASELAAGDYIFVFFR
jgi:hypothetical protein